MPLFSRIAEFFRWHFAVMGAFMSIRPVLTPVLVWALATANITRILAFFLPLKVLLLVATPGVPRYFRFFIEPELRFEWAVGLSIGAVVAYIMTLILDKYSEYLSEQGSRDLLQKSSQLSVVRDQKTLAKRYFSSFSDVSASLLLGVILLAAGFLIHPWLFIFLSGLIFAQLLFSWACLRLVEPREPKGLGGYILRKQTAYLGYLYAINFLAAFAFLVGDFLFFDGINVLIAILSFLIARQLLGALSGLVSTGTSLMGKRPTIDPLVFLDQQHVKQARTMLQELQHQYDIPRRQARIRELLTLQDDVAPDEVSSLWLDPHRGSYLFAIEARDSEGQPLFQGLERVIPPKLSQNLDNEDLIVGHLGAGPLCLADTRSDYEVGSFRCRLYDLGEARPLSRAAWKRCETKFVTDMWQVVPPKGLKEVFELSQPYLGERFAEHLLERFALALDEEWKCEIHQALSERLAEIQARLDALPLFPYNAGVSEKVAFETDEGELRVASWGRWSLEPVGVGLAQNQLSEQRLKSQVELLKQRSDCPADLSSRDLRLANLAFRIEDLVHQKSAFNGAFRLAEQLLKQLDGGQASERSVEGDGRAMNA